MKSTIHLFGINKCYIASYPHSQERLVSGMSNTNRVCSNKVWLFYEKNISEVVKIVMAPLGQIMSRYQRMFCYN